MAGGRQRKVQRQPPKLAGLLDRARVRAQNLSNSANLPNVRVVDPGGRPGAAESIVQGQVTLAVLIFRAVLIRVEQRRDDAVVHPVLDAKLQRRPTGFGGNRRSSRDACEHPPRAYQLRFGLDKGMEVLDRVFRRPRVHGAEAVEQGGVPVPARLVDSLRERLEDIGEDGGMHLARGREVQRKLLRALAPSLTRARLRPTLAHDLDESREIAPRVILLVGIMPALVKKY